VKCGLNGTSVLLGNYEKCREVLGYCTSGTVTMTSKRISKDEEAEKFYAVKKFRRRAQESAQKYQKRLTSEFCISSCLLHPNVVHTLDLLQDKNDNYCEVMEFCAGGDLYTLVLRAGKLETAEPDCYFKQLMRGVEYLHEMGVAHHDLKPQDWCF